ncbi:hypothetical protein RYZ27_08975 [Hyphomonas sp. FCG-A18]|uniref:hypothetical protein n=1 Tax=Hyphomonas sp. FCG-A18 TaxID=3080019 RepID=UPI002B28B0AE|nr:hypothetical protein RYZ27_08975 [Hyphomonas sp. FCG-A18]
MRREILIILSFLIGLPSFAEPQYPQVKSNAFIEAIAQRGAECRLLTRWQALSLRAMALEDRKRFTPQQRSGIDAAIRNQLASMTCKSDSLTVWVDAAREGFETEMLAPYLIVYQSLAKMPDPPQTFSAVSLRTDYAPVLEMIDTKLKEFETSGRVAEGGKPWPNYIERTKDAALGFVSSLENDGGDQAAAWIAQSALIVESWYEEETSE